MNKLFRRADALILLAVVLLTAVAALILPRGRGDRVIISADGQTVASYSLNEQAELTVNGVNIIICDGAAYISSSDCATEQCVRSGKISRAGQSIVCLPNCVSVCIDGAQKPTTDGVTY